MTDSKKKTKLSKKTDNEALSLNHSKSIKFRLRIQEDNEREQELKEWDNAGKQIQDDIRRDDFSE